MVNPARIRRRIAHFEINEEETALSDHAVFVDVVIDGAVKWYLSYVTFSRTFYLRAPYDEASRPRRPQPTGHLRDYLVSILPPEIIARCTAASLRVAP